MESELREENDFGKGAVNESNSAEYNPENTATYGITEELTAEIVKRFLEKNVEGVEEIAIAHSDQADQLLAHKGTLTWRFIFDDPCYFDVSAKRKKERKLHKLLAHLNENHPELKFTYAEDRVIATGFFTKSMQPYDLIKEVERVSGFFRE